ncbi:MAG: hypothetical protein LBI45_07245 [Bacteroidales bacterium]|jgi:hypothetical protein|nr:hypothetical protein [Bacteroidales bacterium]
MENKINIVDSTVIGRSPAAVYMATGIIEINKDVWHKFTPYERAFIIQHERGHYLLPTEFEKEADAYALVQTLKINQSALKDGINALAKMNLKDKSRLNALYHEAALIKHAGKTSYPKINQNSNDMRKKLNHSDNPFQKAAANGAMLPIKKKRKNRKKRADGTDDTPVTTTTYGKSHKVNGFAIGNIYFSMTNILLAAILISLFVISGKLKK